MFDDKIGRFYRLTKSANFIDCPTSPLGSNSTLFDLL